MEFQSYAAGVNNQVTDALKNHINANNQVMDLVPLKKELIKSTGYLTMFGTELAVFTDDYELLFHTTDFWICSFPAYAEGKQLDDADYGYLNPGSGLAKRKFPSWKIICMPIFGRKRPVISGTMKLICRAFGWIRKWLSPIK
jgi:hypothetical protein